MNALRFESKTACQEYLDTHGIIALPHNQITHWIAVCFLPQGVFGVVSPETAVLLPDW